MQVTRISMLTGTAHTLEIPVDPHKLGEYMEHGEYCGQRMLQDVFPELTADDREFLKTGITHDEWEEHLSDVE